MRKYFFRGMISLLKIIIYDSKGMREETLSVIVHHYITMTLQSGTCLSIL